MKYKKINPDNHKKNDPLAPDESNPINPNKDEPQPNQNKDKKVD